MLSFMQSIIRNDHTIISNSVYFINLPSKYLIDRRRKPEYSESHHQCELQGMKRNPSPVLKFAPTHGHCHNK